MMNKVFLQGRLTKVPELKVTDSGIDVLNFSLAVQSTYKKQGAEAETDFFNCVAWQKTAKFIETYFTKGDGIIVVGRLKTRKYIDHDGNNQTATEIVAEQIDFPLTRKQSDSTQTGSATQDDEPKNWVAIDADDTDDLPF